MFTLPVPSWCDVTLGFGADSGTDGDTVAHILGVLVGLTVSVTDTAGATQDLVVLRVEQSDDPDAGYPCLLVGHPLWEGDEPTDEIVRVALDGARIIVY